MKSRKILFAIATGIVVFGLLFIWHISLNEELGSKEEWSIIQATRFQYETKLDGRIRVVTNANYSLVGVPVSDDRLVVWIMLNAKNAPFYKQIPPGNFVLSKSALTEILNGANVTTTVQNCLESHVDYGNSTLKEKKSR